MMNDIALMLEEIRNKLDELDHKVNKLYVFSFPQMTWNDDSFNKTAELEEIKAESTEIFPHQITEDEYKKDGRYAKIEIIYYEVDGVFATFDDKLVEYLSEEYFGIDNLNLFDEDCNIYLRSETKYVDYHMVYEGCTSYFAEHKGEN